MCNRLVRFVSAGLEMKTCLFEGWKQPVLPACGSGIHRLCSSWPSALRVEVVALLPWEVHSDAPGFCFGSTGVYQICVS